MRNINVGFTNGYIHIKYKHTFCKKFKIFLKQFLVVKINFTQLIYIPL